MSADPDFIDLEMDFTAPSSATPESFDPIDLDLTDAKSPRCAGCNAVGVDLNEQSICQLCYVATESEFGAPVATLAQDLTAIAAGGAANAAVTGIGSRRAGTMRVVGFNNEQGYIQAIRNGVPGHTHESYLQTLRVTYGMTTADIAALALPGPMAVTALPDGPGVKHVPTGPSVFDRPRAERAFVVGPTAGNYVEPAAVVKLEHGSIVAGAVADGHGVLVGWSGKGRLTRGALLDAIALLAVKAPQATSARAQAGRVMSDLTGLGYVVRVAREGAGQANHTMWTVGRVNHRSAVGAELGSVEMRATLRPDGTISTEGNEGLGLQVQAKYAALVEGEIYQAGDITSWLGRTLSVAYDAVRFGVGWYVPARHAAHAAELCATVSKIWGTDWIVPALPVATSDQLRDGIVRGLTSEVDALMARLATERATADAAAKAKDGRASSVGDIGPKRGQTFLHELRGIGARIVAYGQILGEERLASAQEQVRQAVAELETVLGDDYSGIAARFAGVWDEIELDRKRSGGVL